jgi:phosphatidylserine/phosphatidylglycerophosphate/cardiolipin synthase-like enzyme
MQTYQYINFSGRFRESDINDLRVLPGTPVYGGSHVRSTWKEVIVGQDEKVICYFDHIKDHLIQHINAADCIIGCVAWLTSKDILQALEDKLVSIIVQKEDFLRPDEDDHENRREIKRLYSNLTPVRRDQLPDTALNYCAMGDFTWGKEGAVRCVGHSSPRKQVSTPRMHHKFVIFCKRNRSKFEPYSVWTGSFNFSETASKCAENAIVLNDSKIVDGYMQEYGALAAISEPLNWTSRWCAPQYKLGCESSV